MRELGVRVGAGLVGDLVVLTGELGAGKDLHAGNSATASTCAAAYVADVVIARVHPALAIRA